MERKIDGKETVVNHHLKKSSMMGDTKDKIGIPITDCAKKGHTGQRVFHAEDDELVG